MPKIWTVPLWTPRCRFSRQAFRGEPWATGKRSNVRAVRLSFTVLAAVPYPFFTRSQRQGCENAHNKCITYERVNFFLLRRRRFFFCILFAGIVSVVITSADWIGKEWPSSKVGVHDEVPALSPWCSHRTYNTWRGTEELRPTFF